MITANISLKNVHNWQMNFYNAPDLKIIASNREALGMGGETVYRVPSLGLPNQSPASLEALAGFRTDLIICGKGAGGKSQI